MISRFEFYHGAALTRLIHGSKHAVAICQLNSDDNNASYILNDDTGLYVKYSTNRLSPWTFTFRRKHQDEIRLMSRKFSSVYVLLVCNEDGIVCLSFDELKDVLDHHHEDVEWLRVARRKREKYAVSGKDGKLKYKIGDNEYPVKIFSNMK
jgi:hypothetical protein